MPGRRLRADPPSPKAWVPLLAGVIVLPAAAHQKAVVSVFSKSSTEAHDVRLSKNIGIAQPSDQKEIVGLRW
jgi:hypothetical protein